MRTTFALIRVTFALLLALALPAASAFAASTTWSPERLLTPPNNGGIGVHTAVNANDVSAVAWGQVLPSGLDQVQVSVHSPAGWSAVSALSDPASTASTDSVLVDPAGNTTVIWSSNGIFYSASSSDSGATWSPSQALPVEAGYTLLAGAGVDRSGTIELVAAAQRMAGAYATFDVEALVKPLNGAWGAPLHVNATPVGAPSFVMNSAGQGLLVTGFSTYRSDRPGVWAAPQIMTPPAGQIFSHAAGLDAGGRAYFVLRTHYGGAYVATAAPGGAWSTPRHVAKFDSLGSTLLVTGSSAGHAVIYGVDYNTNKARAAVTTDGGASWGPLQNLGGGQYSTDNLMAVGADSGQYAVAWNNDGDTFSVATGTGVGSGNAAWAKTTLAANLARGSVALTDQHVVSAWVRGTDALLTNMVVGVMTGTAAP